MFLRFVNEYDRRTVDTVCVRHGRPVFATGVYASFGSGSSIEPGGTQVRPADGDRWLLAVWGELRGRFAELELEQPPPVPPNCPFTLGERVRVTLGVGKHEFLATVQALWDFPADAKRPGRQVAAVLIDGDQHPAVVDFADLHGLEDARSPG